MLGTSHENLERTNMTESAEGATLETTTESERFDQISITLHWLTVILIIVLFASAWSRETLDHDTRLASALMTVHRTTGLVVWIVGWVRLVWRYKFAYLPPFPESMPKLQQWVAKANEYSLYALLVAQPISGLGHVLFHGHPFKLFIWEVPALVAPNPAIRSMFVTAHEFGAKALVALIALHAGAALFHRFVLRDRVLQRMLPWESESAAARTNGLVLFEKYVKKKSPLSPLANLKLTVPLAGQNRKSHSHQRG
jgi:superoxide oxidase